MAGNAMLDAADKIRHQINTVMAEKWGCSESDITATNGIYRTENHEATWTEVIWATESQVGALGSTGSFTPDTDSARARRMPIGPSPAYSFTAQVAELTVDPDTGFITIHDIWCAHDLGRTLHPDIADGQIEGCVYMGVGEALFEEQAYQGPIMMTPSILNTRSPLWVIHLVSMPFRLNHMIQMVRSAQKKWEKVLSYRLFLPLQMPSHTPPDLG